MIGVEPGREAWERGEEGAQAVGSSAAAGTELAQAGFGPHCSGYAALGLPWGVCRS